MMNGMRLFCLMVIVTVMATAQTKPLFIVFLNPNPAREELPKERVDSLLAGHMANMNRLAREQKLLAAGPFDGGGGIFVFGADSKPEVAGWLITDPGIQAKRWTTEIFRYHPRIGSVCPVGEKYQMTSYLFLRYSVLHSEEKAGALRRYESFLQGLPKDSVVAEGLFDEKDHGIVVLRVGLGRTKIENHPVFRDGVVSMTLKNIWIARGSFCER